MAFSGESIRKSETGVTLASGKTASSKAVAAITPRVSKAITYMCANAEISKHRKGNHRNMSARCGCGETDSSPYSIAFSRSSMTEHFVDSVQPLRSVPGSIRCGQAPKSFTLRKADARLGTAAVSSRSTQAVIWHPDSIVVAVK